MELHTEVNCGERKFWIKADTGNSAYNIEYRHEATKIVRLTAEESCPDGVIRYD